MGDIHASDLRKNIHKYLHMNDKKNKNKNKNKNKQFLFKKLPKKLTNQNKTEIWKIIMS